jgi:hypothetical protein
MIIDSADPPLHSSRSWTAASWRTVYWLLLTDLRSSSHYRFQISSSNEFGTSERSQLTANISTGASCCVSPKIANTGGGSDECVCGAGWYTADNTCAKCEENTYNDELSASSCKACPLLSKSRLGSTTDDECTCAFGTVGRASAGCVCPAGTSKLATPSGGLICKKCPPDTFSEAQDAPSCSPCPVRSGTNGISRSSTRDNCTCRQGMVLDSEAQCVCPPGSKAAGDDAASTSDGECIVCGKNTYNDVRGAISCKACPLLSESEPGSTSLSSCGCSTGTVRDPSASSGSGSCLCPAGKKTSLDGGS